MSDREDWNSNIIQEFRANEGKVGGPFDGAPLLLLHTTGAHSGEERINPMMYLADGDRLVVFASKGGAPTNPDWYHNLKANPRVDVELGTETVRVDAHELAPAERAEKWAEITTRAPGFADYQKKTERVIPVFALQRVA